jgi:beta-glucosidase
MLPRIATPTRSKRRVVTTVGAVLVAGAGVLVSAQNATAAGPLYLNRHASAQARAADLVHRMTLSEQIGQMLQAQVGHLYGTCTGSNPGPLNPTCEQQVLVNDGAGSILSGGGDVPGEGALPNTPQTWADQINAIEKYSIDNSRLHIPIIYGADVVHGHNDVVNATLFPQQIGLGATFDPQLVQAAQTSAGKAAAATNVRWAFAPVADVDTNSRWGRYYESFSEDPILSGTLAAASVTGLQSSGTVTASVKHFAPYAAAENGLDRTAADMSLRNFQTNQLPSYAKAVQAGALTVMVDSGSVNGVPADASHFLLTDVLRNQLGFTGVVISDWNDITALATRYHVAADAEHAVAIAVNAGVDESMEPNDPDGFVTNLTKAVQDGLVSKKRVEQAADRILVMKFKLGLFDHPYVDASQANSILGADLPLARTAAAESSVLLRNQNNVLPFSPSSKLVVTGPTADSIPDTLGGWSVGWQGVPAGSAETAVTVLKGLQDAGGSNVTYAPTQADAVTKLGSADAAVVVLGRKPGAEGPNDQRDPTLPADQQALVTALKATGKPVVVVLIDDRPDALGTANTADGLLMAWRPGTEGGHGVADVLYGAVNPSARLPVSWPKNGSDQPNTYRQTDISTTGSGYDPQYPFGAGLSYTTYTSTVSAVSGGSHKSVNVTLDIANTGTKAGDLVVPVYVSQPVSAVLVPVKRLVGFTRVHLDAGQAKSVTVNVQSSALGVVPGDVNASGPLAVEHGNYVFSTGTAAGSPTSSATNTITL